MLNQGGNIGTEKIGSMRRGVFGIRGEVWLPKRANELEMTERADECGRRVQIARKATVERCQCAPGDSGFFRWSDDERSRAVSLGVRGRKASRCGVWLSGGFVLARDAVRAPAWIVPRRDQSAREANWRDHQETNGSAGPSEQ